MIKEKTFRDLSLFFFDEISNPGVQLLLLQTIDGKIHAIDRDNGRALWGEKALQLNKDWFPKVKFFDSNIKKLTPTLSGFLISILMKFFLRAI